MKKSLIALSVLAAFSGMAHAQTNVAVYGIVDTGLVKETGSDVRMGSNWESRIGFKGTEDLGSGLKATFQLEKRINLNDGTKADGYTIDTLNGRDNIDWKGAANVGLKSDAWGAVSLGRVNDIAIENFSNLDPFAYYSVGSAFGGISVLYSEQIPNTLRYDSPEWAGLAFNLSYSVGQDKHHGNAATIDGVAYPYGDYGNDGFGIGVKYDNGPLLLTANYDRLADSDKSWIWNAGGAYTWEGLTFSLGYQGTTIRSAAAGALGIADTDIKQKDWLFGVQYNTGAHTVKFSYNRGEVESRSDYDGKANKYALGYDYALSKRTTLYAIAAYTDSDNGAVGAIYNTNGAANDSVTGVQLGIQHRF